VLTYGDEVDTLAGAGPSGGDFTLVECRGRVGEWKEPPLSTERMLEMYFLDVGQGDAAFVVTPNDTKILVDGGIRERALGFLIWKYRLDVPGNSVRVDHLLLSHADSDHVEGLIPLLNHPQITCATRRHVVARWCPCVEGERYQFLSNGALSRVIQTRRQDRPFATRD
jgi:competence protein ComEC